MKTITLTDKELNELITIEVRARALKEELAELDKRRHELCGTNKKPKQKRQRRSKKDSTPKPKKTRKRLNEQDARVAVLKSVRQGGPSTVTAIAKGIDGLSRDRVAKLVEAMTKEELLRAASVVVGKGTYRERTITGVGLGPASLGNGQAHMGAEA